MSPVRTVATRTPPLVASFAVASQSTTTWARKSVPERLSSSRIALLEPIDADRGGRDQRLRTGVGREHSVDEVLSYSSVAHSGWGPKGRWFKSSRPDLTKRPQSRRFRTSGMSPSEEAQGPIGVQSHELCAYYDPLRRCAANDGSARGIEPAHGLAQPERELMGGQADVSIDAALPKVPQRQEIPAGSPVESAGPLRCTAQAS
jgi:hypothetical protein